MEDLVKKKPPRSFLPWLMRVDIHTRNDFELHGEEERAERSKRDFSHLPPPKKKGFRVFFFFFKKHIATHYRAISLSFSFLIWSRSFSYLLVCLFTIRNVAYIVPSWVACCIKRVPIKMEGGRGREGEGGGYIYIYISYSSTFFFFRKKERKIWVLILNITDMWHLVFRGNYLNKTEEKKKNKLSSLFFNKRSLFDI